MSKEEKDLVLKDLSARLPYGVKCYNTNTETDCVLEDVADISSGYPTFDYGFGDIESIKPYLRPMSSMTEEERKEIGKAIKKDRISPYGEIKLSGVDNLLLAAVNGATNLIDWLNAHHFDYRGLIEKGLAIAVTEENNPYKD